MELALFKFISVMFKTLCGPLELLNTKLIKPRLNGASFVPNNLNGVQ